MQYAKKWTIIGLFIILTLIICGSIIPMEVGSLSTEGGGSDETSRIVPDGVEYLFNHSGLPHHSTAFNGPRKYILEDGNNVYFAYTWMNNSKMTLTMLSSYDGGKNWTSPLDIWRDTTLNNYENN